MRKKTKYKKTILSALFIEAFFLLVGSALKPAPVLSALVDIFAETV